MDSEITNPFAWPTKTVDKTVDEREQLHLGEQPTHYATEEGGAWQPWPKDPLARFGYCSKLYSNGDIYDVDVGWRYRIIPGGIVHVKSPNAAVFPPKAPDAVKLPDHYARYKIEPIHFITENELDFFQGNIIKYVCRWDAKDGVQDLKKAARYLEMYIKYAEGQKDYWK